MKSNYARARTSFRARSSACRVVWSNSPYILTKRARWLTGRVCRRSAIDGLLRPFGGRFDFHVGPDLGFFLTPFRDRHHLNDRDASIVIELQILSCTEAQAITVAANGQYLAVVAEAIQDRGRHDGIPEHRVHISHAAIPGEQQAAPFVASRHPLEEPTGGIRCVFRRNRLANPKETDRLIRAWQKVVNITHG